MNFFRDKELAQRFSRDEVPEREQFWYLIVITLLYSLATTSWMNNLVYEAPNMWDHVLDGVLVGSALLGLVWMYQINAKGDGQNFIARYVCLSFPVAIKAILLMCILLVGLFALAEFFEQIVIPEEGSSIHFVVICVLFLTYFYLRLAYAMRIASGAKKEEASP